MNSKSAEVLLNQIAPRLHNAVRRVSMLGCEDADELRQDAVTMAAAMLDQLETQNKKVTPSNIAFYTIRLLRSGRRSTGSSNTHAMRAGLEQKLREFCGTFAA
jgi:hypothetical protein